ncbi:kelch repeat and BTB domain-containing protein 8-like [Branchiostoma lanceolatum]|uniref:kelch repeat and BTB domain-containing protein 8-like n=1 Tax=Branchiostoma lanceolatum TaxID=7740 RepID=UPI003452F754
MAAAQQENHDRPVRPRSYDDISYRDGFLGIIGDFQKTEVLQDVVLEVEGRQLPCHRLVLSAASPYFRAMFTSGMAESRQKTVVLQGLDASMFGEILSYIYSGTLHVSLDKVQPLYQAADLLQLDYVRDTCSSYMAMNVERFNCVDLYKFADVFSVDVVRNRCLQCIYMHFIKVSSSEEFCSLSVNQLTEIISHDELDVTEETTVWEAVVRWVQHSREDRLHHLPSILPHIRFNLMTSDDTAAILEHPLVMENSGNSELRTLVMRETSNQKRRFGMDAEEMAIMFRSAGPSTNTREMLCFNPREQKYTKYSYSVPRIIKATVTSVNDIYILGEESNEELSLLQYNHLGNVWEKKSSFHREIPECLPSDFQLEYLFEVDGHLYYLAVHFSKGRSVSVVTKKYEWLTDQWQDCSKPRHDDVAMKSHVATTCGGQIYIFTNIVRGMHCYDPSQDLWSKITLPINIFHLSTAVAMGMEIFFTDSSLSKIGVYDVEADSWRELPGWSDPNRYPDPNQGATFFAHEGQLHVFVELYTDPPEDNHCMHVCKYDMFAGGWSDSPVPLPDWTWRMCRPVPPVARMYKSLPWQDVHMDTRDTEHPQGTMN